MPSAGSRSVPSPITGGETLLISEVPCEDLRNLYFKQFRLEVSSYFSDISRLEYRECAASGVRFFHPLRPGDGRFYRELSNFDWYYSAQKDEYQQAAALLAQARTVLDVGCGAGKFAAAVPHAQFTGLDFSDAAIAAAHKAGRRVLKQSIEEHAAAHSGAYDAVTAFQVLEHVTDPLGLLQAMVRATRPGGLVVVSVPAEDGALGGRINYTLNLPPHHLTHWTDRALMHVMHAAGLADLALHRMPLAAQDESEAVTQYLARAIRGPGLTRRLVRLGAADRAFFALVRRAARILPRAFLPRFACGHTVVATGRKPS